jgi:hypothetical protein
MLLENWMSTCRRLKIYPISHPVQKSKTLKVSQKNTGKTLQDAGRGNDSNSTGYQSKDWQMGLHQTIKLLHIEGNNYHSEEIAYSMGENSLAVHLTGDEYAEYMKN